MARSGRFRLLHIICNQLRFDCDLNRINVQGLRHRLLLCHLTGPGHHLLQRQGGCLSQEETRSGRHHLHKYIYFYLLIYIDHTRSMLLDLQIGLRHMSDTTFALNYWSTFVHNLHISSCSHWHTCLLWWTRIFINSLYVVTPVQTVSWAKDVSERLSL